MARGWCQWGGAWGEGPSPARGGVSLVIGVEVVGGVEFGLFGNLRENGHWEAAFRMGAERHDFGLTVLAPFERRV